MANFSDLQLIEHLHDVLGRAVDTAENYAEYGTHATTPAFARLDPQLRIGALSNGLQELRDTIKALYFEMGGEDVWQ